MGRNLFDVVDGPGGWSDDIGYGAHNVGRPPFFVVTHKRPRRAASRTSTSRSSPAASPPPSIGPAPCCPPDKDVVVMGGGNVIAQALDAGLPDELTLHVSPIVFGGGTPLFDGVGRRQLGQIDVRVSPHATHITYSLDGAPL